MESIYCNITEFEAILSGKKRFIHSFLDEMLKEEDLIEILERNLENKETGRKLTLKVTYVEKMDIPFNVYFISFRVINGEGI